ncbi:hypothetical protein OHB49_42620 (plasmid) [Streptomyces sp. NBC_01717]|uniref:hypothetical protein n=1 Tax=Streptomyces sp. NBC_01717 TaxID=2975918 RepID=UPI002E332A73|nr:hypothetical protein [Streptomyces sp. NBC_01717]
MLPESVDEFSGGELTVPMRWMCADDLADRLMVVADVLPRGSQEYRCGRAALAVTVFVSPRIAEFVTYFDEDQRDYWTRVTSDPDTWHAWASAKLERLTARSRATGRPDPDLTFAEAAWRRLTGTELLLPGRVVGPAPTGDGGSAAGPGRLWLPAWDLGVTIGHLVLHRL